MNNGEEEEAMVKKNLDHGPSKSTTG